MTNSFLASPSRFRAVSSTRLPPPLAWYHFTRSTSGSTPANPPSKFGKLRTFCWETRPPPVLYSRKPGNCMMSRLNVGMLLPTILLSAMLTMSPGYALVYSSHSTADDSRVTKIQSLRDAVTGTVVNANHGIDPLYAVVNFVMAGTERNLFDVEAGTLVKSDGYFTSSNGIIVTAKGAFIGDLLEYLFKFRTKNNFEIGKTLTDAGENAGVGNGDLLIQSLSRSLIRAAPDKDENNETPLHMAAFLNAADQVQILLEAGANIEAVNNFGRTPLHVAASMNAVEAIGALLDAGANVEALDDSKETPLHHAAQLRNTDVYQDLLFAKANTKVKNAIGWILLLEATRSRNEASATLALLNAGANTEAMNEDGFTPLHVAAANDAADAVRVLLAAGAHVEAISVNDENSSRWTVRGCVVKWNLFDSIDSIGKDEARDDKKCTPLHVAAANNAVDAIQVLLEAGANIEKKTHKGMTPLHWAIMGNATEVTRILLEAGANTESRNNDGFTVLHKSTMRNMAETILDLLDAGANIEAKDNEGMTPLHIAVRLNVTNKTRALLDAESNTDSEVMNAIQTLLSAGADVEAKDVNGRTPLLVAARQNEVNVTKSLLSAGANTEAMDNDGMGPLHWAAFSNAAGTARVLLDVGANIDIRTGLGNTPLHFAVRNNAIATVALLLDEGASIRVRNNDGKTPFQSLPD